MSQDAPLLSSPSHWYTVGVVLTAPFWMPAIVLGAICGAIFVGFTAAFMYMTKDTRTP